MSERISSFLKRVQGKDIEKATALEYITTIGTLGDQIAGIPETDEEIIEQGAKFSKALLPYLNTEKNHKNYTLLVKYLENYEEYLQGEDLLTELKAYKKEYDVDVSALITGVNFTRAAIKPLLVDDGKIIISLTYKTPSYKTIVLDKPYILDPTGYRGDRLPKKTLIPKKGDTT